MLEQNSLWELDGEEPVESTGFHVITAYEGLDALSAGITVWIQATLASHWSSLSAHCPSLAVLLKPSMSSLIHLGISSLSDGLPLLLKLVLPSLMPLSISLLKLSTPLVPYSACLSLSCCEYWVSNVHVLCDNDYVECSECPRGYNTSSISHW